MAIYNFIKPQGQKLLKPVVKIFIKLNPDFLTFLGLVFSLFAGLCFFMSQNKLMLLIATPFILLRMVFNVMDGMVARQAGRTSAYGEALTEFLDRVSDVVILLGVAFSPYCNRILGLLGIISVLIVSYLGILGKTVGAERQFGGILGKVDRLILIMFFSVIQYFLGDKQVDLLNGLKGFDILMILFIIGGIITAVQRWRRISRQLGKEQR